MAIVVLLFGTSATITMTATVTFPARASNNGHYNASLPRTVTERFSEDAAIAEVNKIRGDKKIPLFMGYSAVGYESPEMADEILIGKLKALDPKTHIIESGATNGGISRVYPLAKQMGFETIFCNAFLKGVCR